MTYAVTRMEAGESQMPPYAAAYWSCLPIGFWHRSISMVAGPVGQLVRATEHPLVGEEGVEEAHGDRDDEPSPEPADGMSARVVISTPPRTPAMCIASRTRSCCEVLDAADDLLLE